nr:hypothetical protein [uncultured Rhodopila sp.]
MSGSPAPDPLKQHERLIDHFKRVYSIVAGLALTEACRRSLPIESIFDFRLWMFATLFITLVPIFHGGDRSLDQKHCGRPPQTVWERVAFVWDDYMLLLTAVLFVCIAESIPSAADIGTPSDFAPGRFYFWMSVTFGFDVFVLGVDYVKNWQRRSELRPYWVWIVANSLLCYICLRASQLVLLDYSVKTVSVALLGDVTLFTLSVVVFICALLRTIVDYSVGDAFLFPRTNTGQTI